MFRTISIGLFLAIPVATAIWVLSAERVTPPVAGSTVIPDTVPGADTSSSRHSDTTAQEAVAGISAIVEEYALNDAVAPQPDITNNEATPTADTIGQSQATSPAFITAALDPENFDAERVVSLIRAAPQLNLEQKAELQTAVQATLEYPEARRQILAKLETILLSQT